MSFTVNQVMERVGSNEAQRVIEYIRDSFIELALLGKRQVVVSKQDIIDGKKAYALPSEVVAVTKVSVMHTEYEEELIDDVENRDFSAASDWTNTDFATYSETDDLSVVNDAADQSCYLDVDDQIEAGKRYRLKYNCTLTSGTFELQSVTDSVKLGSFVDGEGKYIEFTAPADDQIKIVGTAAAGQADFDNFSLTETEKDKYGRARRIVGDLYARWIDKMTE